ncbi:MAG: efflux RND transporter permease subunit, partial [Planktothrix sp.]
FISNYIDLFIVDQISRIPGVGQVTIFGERKYAMRLWLDPSRMAARGLTAQDVVRALREQNIQVGAGTLGQQPTPPGQLFEIPLQAVSRLRTAEEFAQMVLKTNDDGSLVTIQDVRRAELGAESYDLSATFNGDPAVGVGI